MRNNIKKTPGQLIMKIGGEWVLIIVGLPFLLFGLFVLGSLIKTKGADANYYIAGTIFGAVFTLFGIAMTALRGETIFDREASTMTNIVRLIFVPIRIRRCVRSLKNMGKVIITSKIVTPSKFSRLVYAAHLVPTEWDAANFDTLPAANNFSKNISMDKGLYLMTGDFSEVRLHAEEVAQFLNFKLQDYTAGQSEQVAANTKPSKFEERTPNPHPHGTRITLYSESGNAVIEIGPPRFQFIHGFYFFIGAGVPPTIYFFALRDFLAEMNTVTAFLLAFFFSPGTICVAIFLVTYIAAIRSLTLKTKLIFSSDCISVQKKWLLRKKKTEIPFARIKRIETAGSSMRYREAGLHDGTVVRLIWREGDIEIGELLTNQESERLYKEIKRLSRLFPADDRKDKDEN